MNKAFGDGIADQVAKPGFLIMAVPRSGTTLLARLMNAHPDVVCGSERFHGHTFSPDSLTENGFRTLDLERGAAVAANAELDAKADRPSLIFGEKYPRAYLHMRTTMPRFEAAGATLKMIVPMRNADEVAQSWYQRAINPKDQHWPAGMYGVFPYIEQLLLARCLANRARPEDVLLVSYEKMLDPISAPGVFETIAAHIGVDDAAPFVQALQEDAKKTEKSRLRDRSVDPTMFEAGAGHMPDFTSLLGDAGSILLPALQSDLGQLVDACIQDKAARGAMIDALADTSDPHSVTYRQSIQNIYARELPEVDADFAQQALAAMKPKAEQSEANTMSPHAATVTCYDISDLLTFLAVHNSVTGIHRVQLDAVLAAAADTAANARDRVVVLDASRGWIALPLKHFAQSMTSGEPLGAAAKAILAELPQHDPMSFGPGHAFVFFGATWTAPELTTSMGDLRRAGAQIIAYIHDVLPLEVPEHFQKRHAEDFVHWLKSILTNASGILCNSEETKAALVRHTRLKHPVGVVDLSVMPNFVQAHMALPEEKRNAPLDVLGLSGVEYVLSVGTLEPRKNHQTLINAWTTLRRRLGQSCPKLVLVGKDGWKTAGIHEALDSIGEHCDVLLLQNVDDQTLAALFENALLTVTLSRREGWNLPVTESLASGVPVLAGTGSAAKAAQQGLVFEADALSERSVFNRLQQILTDRDGLAAQRETVRQNAQFKGWRDFIAETRAFVDTLPPVAPKGQSVEAGRTYRFGRDQEVSLTSTKITGLQMRTGLGWNAPDSWGCWSRASTAVIDLHDLPAGSYTAYIIVTTNDKISPLPLRVLGAGGSTWQGNLRSGQRSLVTVDFSVAPAERGNTTLTFESGEPYNFAADDTVDEIRTIAFAIIELVIRARADLPGRVETMEGMLRKYMAY